MSVDSACQHHRRRLIICDGGVVHGPSVSVELGASGVPSPMSTVSRRITTQTPTWSHSRAGIAHTNLVLYTADWRHRPVMDAPTSAHSPSSPTGKWHGSSPTRSSPKRSVTRAGVMTIHTDHELSRYSGGVSRNSAAGITARYNGSRDTEIAPNGRTCSRGSLPMRILASAS